NGVEDATQGVGPEAGRGASSEEQGSRDGGGIFLLETPPLEDGGVRVARHQMVAVRGSGERGVVAALRAEGEVDAGNGGAHGRASPAQRRAVERTERMRRSRWASMASVASPATSSAPGGGGPASTAARSPPRMRRNSASASGLMGRPLRCGRQSAPPVTR